MKQHHPDIDHLLSKYLSGRLTSDENMELERWVKESSHNREIFENLKQFWSMSATGDCPSSLDHVRDRIWAAGAIQPQTMKMRGKGKSRGFFPWVKVAAVFLLLLAGGWFSYYLIQEKISVPSSVAWIEIINPAGQKSSHKLPDGTKVWLNSASSLSYPVEFSDTIRLVRMEGEAYYEVVSDPQHPFIVETSGIMTQALGTSFNIQAYHDDPEIKIALLEGRIKVEDEKRMQSIILLPGEELLSSKEHPSFLRRRFQYETTFGWKEGLLVFDEADFLDFRTTIEKWYGVKVEVIGTPPDDWSIRARYQQETLHHVLQDISFTKNIRFEMKDKDVRIIF